jgi:hypothetical protein
MLIFVCQISSISADDVLLQKRVRFYFQVNNAGDYSDYLIIAYPVHQSKSTYNQVIFINDSTGKVISTCGSNTKPTSLYATRHDDLNHSEFYSLIPKSRVKQKFNQEFADYLDNNFITLTEIICNNLVDEDSQVESITDVYTIFSKYETLVSNRTKTIYENEDGTKKEVSYVIVWGSNDSFKEESEPVKFYFALPFLSLFTIASVLLIRNKSKKKG